MALWLVPTACSTHRALIWLVAVSSYHTLFVGADGELLTGGMEQSQWEGEELGGLLGHLGVASLDYPTPVPSVAGKQFSRQG